MPRILPKFASKTVILAGAAWSVVVNRVFRWQVGSAQGGGRHKLRSVLALLLVILAGGGGLVGWTVAEADHDVRDELLRQTHRLARALNIQVAQSLTGTPADERNPEYLRFKEEFAAVRAATPLCSSIYLLGRQGGRSAAVRPGEAPPPCGDVCFIVGGGMDHEVRPGQAYTTASKELKRAFETGTPYVEGPHADAWGEWISGRVPILDLKTKGPLAVLDMSMDARAWKQRLLRAALPPALLTLALAALLILGVVLLSRLSHSVDPPSRWVRHLKLAWVITAGLMLTGCFTWMTHRGEAHQRSLNFELMVDLRTRVVASAMRSVSRMELESLARLYESNGDFADKEFQLFSAHLEKIKEVHLWGMVPAVAAADKAGFEAQVRAAGVKDFEIWQKDAQGRRVPASGRDVYYPVRQVAPMADNASVLGYDLGSDPRCREALEAAARDGLASVTGTAKMLHIHSDRNCLMILQPIRTAGEAPRLRGFVMADLSLETLLQKVPSDDTVLLEISLLSKDAPPEILAKQWKSASRPSIEISAQRPVLIFGKAFAVTALVGPEFLRYRSQRNTWWPPFMGLLLTAAFAVSYGTQLYRHSVLEHLVAERTHEIQDSETRFRLLTEAAFEGIAIVDAGLVLDGNQRFAEMHGYELAEILGRPGAEFIAPQSQSLLADDFHVSHQKSRRGYGLRKDGSIFPAEVRARIGPWLGRTVRIVTVRDHTEAHAAETKHQTLMSELAHAQRLALVSELSAGIIHQLGQPLSAIGINLAALPTLKAVEWQQCGALEIIKDVEDDVARMRDIVNHLRAMANPSQANLKSHDINASVAKVLPLLQTRAERFQIRFELNLHKPLPAICADAIQINQVILNLVLNAIDASDDVPPARRVVLITTCLHAGRGVELCVRDQGTGLTPEAMERMFTPFFTTKSNGMGIGLRLCQTIVHSHDGHIEGFNNADGPGTTFRIMLPLTRLATHTKRGLELPPGKPSPGVGMFEAGGRQPAASAEALV